MVFKPIDKEQGEGSTSKGICITYTLFVFLKVLHGLARVFDLKGSANISSNKPRIAIFINDANKLTLEGKVKEVIHGSLQFVRQNTAYGPMAYNVK